MREKVVPPGTARFLLCQLSTVDSRLGILHDISFAPVANPVRVLDQTRRRL
jgi:hypothetical protein